MNFGISNISFLLAKIGNFESYQKLENLENYKNYWLMRSPHSFACATLECIRSVIHSRDVLPVDKQTHRNTENGLVLSWK